MRAISILSDAEPSDGRLIHACSTVIICSLRSGRLSFYQSNTLTDRHLNMNYSYTWGIPPAVTAVPEINHPRCPTWLYFQVDQQTTWNGLRPVILVMKRPWTMRGSKAGGKERAFFLGKLSQLGLWCALLSPIEHNDQYPPSPGNICGSAHETTDLLVSDTILWITQNSNIEWFSFIR